MSAAAPGGLKPAPASRLREAVSHLRYSTTGLRPCSCHTFSLRLDVYPPPQVLQTARRLCHLVLAFHVVRGVTTQQGPFAPPALPGFPARTDPSATLSPSAHFPGSPVIGPTLLRQFRAGTRRVGIEVRRPRDGRVRWLIQPFPVGPQSGSHGHDVSASPPTIPDGGFSPVRF